MWDLREGDPTLLLTALTVVSTHTALQSLQNTRDLWFPDLFLASNLPGSSRHVTEVTGKAKLCPGAPHRGLVGTHYCRANPYPTVQTGRLSPGQMDWQKPCRMGADQAGRTWEHVHTDPRGHNTLVQPDTQSHSPGCQQPVNHEDNLWYKDRHRVSLRMQCHGEHR